MKVAVVGAGYWGPNLIRNLVGSPRLESLVVCDREPERLQRVRRRNPSVETTEDLDQILGDSSISAVVLATPIGTHGELGSKVLEADKHLFVEKPLAGSVAEAERLVQLARERERVLMVGHTFEYSPAVLKITELLKSGELGKIYFISTTRVNLGLHQRDASVIWDLAPHDLSMILSWVDEPPSRVTAVGRDCVQPGVPDVCFVSLNFPSGIVANIEVAWLAPSKLRRTAIVGERKMLLYDDTENTEKVKLFDQGVDFRDPESFGEFQLSYRTGDVLSPRLPTYEPLQAEMDHFLECVAERKVPRTDGESGLLVVRALEAAENALKTGQPQEL